MRTRTTHASLIRGQTGERTAIRIGRDQRSGQPLEVVVRDGEGVQVVGTASGKTPHVQMAAHRNSMKEG